MSKMAPMEAYEAYHAYSMLGMQPKVAINLPRYRHRGRREYVFAAREALEGHERG